MQEALDEGYQAVALELGKSYEAFQRENARLRAALETYAADENWYEDTSIEPYRDWTWYGDEPPMKAAQLALAPEAVDGK